MIISEAPSRKESAVLSRSFFVEEERVTYTKHDLMFKRLLEKKDILVDFFQTYLRLNEREEAILVEEVRKLEDAEEILKIPNVYVERGKKIGREEGREAGRQSGLEEVALEMLKKGLSGEFIMEVTKLNKEQIEQLKMEL